MTVASASHASTQQNVHPIQIKVIGLPITISAPRAIAAPLAAQGLVVLIGRDVLQHCTLFFNGPAGSFSLSVQIAPKAVEQQAGAVRRDTGPFSLSDLPSDALRLRGMRQRAKRAQG